jgi:alginate O-acetyltransferase complex protein AlgI
LKDNFRFPYAAIGFSDFWRRWHISLSTFLRDYLYIPLGGNRLGAARAMLNLVIVMFLGGLWHGAAWTFVVWGLLHGSYLAIERLLKALVRPAPWMNSFAVQLLIGAVTYFAVLVAWVYFRAPNFETASRMIAGMFGRHARSDAILGSREILQVALVTVGLLFAHWSMRETSLEAVVARMPRWVVGTTWFLMAGAIILTQGNSNAFIYFQF